MKRSEISYYGENLCYNVLLFSEAINLFDYLAYMNQNLVTKLENGTNKLAERINQSWLQN